MVTQSSQDAAKIIQKSFKTLLRVQREREQSEEQKKIRSKIKREEQKRLDKKLLRITCSMQNRWRKNRNKQQILRQLSSLAEHDRALLRQPLRICRERQDEHRDVYTPWGAHLLLYGDLDSIDSLQLIFCPPRDVFYRAYAATRKTFQDVSAFGQAVPSRANAAVRRSRTSMQTWRRWLSRKVRHCLRLDRNNAKPVCY